MKNLATLIHGEMTTSFKTVSTAIHKYSRNSATQTYQAMNDIYSSVRATKEAVLSKIDPAFAIRS